MRRRGSLRLSTLADKSPDSAEETEIEYQTKNRSGWNRELRNRFVLSSGKRSLCLEEKDSHPRRSIRSCRIQVMSRSRSERYGYQTEDDDDSMFGPPPISSRRLKNYREAASSSKQEDGIRRSTRQRKSRYDNYNDSWIVGSQSLRGYPSLNAPFPQGKVKEEMPEEMEEDEEDEEEDDEKPAKPSRPIRSSRLDETRLRSEEPGGVTASREDLQKENGETSRTSERRTRQSKISLDNNMQKVESGGEPPITENGYEDMYARVKQRRRTAAKSESSSESRSSSVEEENDGERLTRERRVRSSRIDRDPSRVESRKYSLRKKKPTAQRFQAAGSSSDSTSSSEGEERRPERLRRESHATPNRRIQRKYSLRQKKPTVQRFQAAPP